VAFWTVDSVVGVESVAAGFAEGVAADHKQARHVEFVVELSLAVTAQHNGYYMLDSGQKGRDGLVSAMVDDNRWWVGNQSVEVPSREVVIVGVLLRPLEGRSQLSLVVLDDLLVDLLAFLLHQFGLAPLLGHLPDLDLLALGSGHQPLLLRNVLQAGNLGIEGLQQV
jgi:hypothetical protein